MEEDHGEEPGRLALPVFLNVAGRVVVVVGGSGAVGARKLAAALAAGAIVRVVDPTAVSGASGPGSRNVVYLREPYEPLHLLNAHLVFACATPQVNARVVADAQLRGVWVNSATDPAAGDFMLPAVIRSGQMTVAVSTGGAAPALARRVREKLASEFDDAFAEWVRILAEVRLVVLAEITDPTRRRELLDSFAAWPWLMRLRAEGVDAVRVAMLALVRSGRET